MDKIIDYRRTLLKTFDHVDNSHFWLNCHVLIILTLFKQTIIITFRLSSFSPGTEALRETGRDWNGVCVKNSTLSPRSVAAVTAARNNTDLLMFTSPITNVLPSTLEGNSKSLVTAPDANRLKTTPKISAITICVEWLILATIHLNVSMTYLQQQRESNMHHHHLPRTWRPTTYCWNDASDWLS